MSKSLTCRVFCSAGTAYGACLKNGLSTDSISRDGACYTGACGFESRKLKTKVFAEKVNVGRRLLGTKEMSGSTPDFSSDCEHPEQSASAEGSAIHNHNAGEVKRSDVTLPV